MPRPPKKGLAYFPKDVDFYQDEKIVELGMKYGPLGLTIYDVLLTLIYREGYCLELPLRRVAMLIVRTVGESWFRKTGMSPIDLSVEVILYCAEIGLINAPLVRQNVITSVGIQKRYAAVTARNKVDKSKFWLLDKNSVDAALESAPKNKVSDAETGVSVTETPINDAEMQQRKENKSKVNKSRCPAEVSASEMKLSTVSTGDDNNVGKKAEFILNEYARLLPMLPAAQMSAKLMSNIITADRPVEDYTRVFTRASESSFLTETRSGWKCGVEWLTEPANMAKVMSGKYDDYRSKTRDGHETITQVGGIESGFDTEDFFRAALRRGMKGAEQHGKPESQ